ncbi:MAG: DUF2520 domain-containing protein [Bacteroidales bacterium]|nr:DUF2520 domain-containing protein [Bacteroidales bacterium]
MNNLDTVQNLKMVFLGAGNLAWNLAQEFHKKGLTVDQVFSRTIVSAHQLAALVGAKYTDNPADIIKDADVYIIAITDNAISDFVSKLDVNGGIVVHTAGSIAIEALEECSENYGVFYPLQTFTKGKNVGFLNIPVCVEANTRDTLQMLRNLGKLISEKVYEVNSSDRKILHLAGIIASNFSNHLFFQANKVLNDHDLRFELLRPLLIETVNKAVELSPNKAQTGPASRGNRNIIESHLEFLSDYPEIKELYEIFSKQILITYT